ncbi:MAG: hypothetical protein R3F11_29685, partial [Verrucomicrobiales bacterium]
MKSPTAFLVAFVSLLAALPQRGTAADPIDVRLQNRIALDGGGWLVQQREESWDPAQTAVIVCDMWDAHHCLNAVRRGTEIAPRVDALLRDLRGRGAMVVHSPSSCMAPYEDTPARKRAQAAPKAANLPEGIGSWLHWIDEREEKAGYPIDHSDGGEDDDPAEHAAWAKKLEAMGRNPGSPWKAQMAAIGIDQERDAISDSGEEIWNLLEQRGAKNILLVGVHTNMCVLGRPFGLRQMAKNGKNVALVRDLTDTMYNPERPPQVSHFHGTDLVIEHIEKYVCPTLTSDQILGGRPMKFRGDARKDLVLIMAEQEYHTDKSVPAFAEAELRPHFRLHYVFAADGDPNRLPGMEALRWADAAFISVRRRTPPEDQLAALREF